jgi:hypothetical protein
MEDLATLPLLINLAPTVTDVTVPLDPISIGNFVRTSGTFTVNDCHRPDHNYVETGVYKVTVIVADKYGGSGSMEAADMIAISDPDGPPLSLAAGWICLTPLSCTDTANTGESVGVCSSFLNQSGIFPVPLTNLLKSEEALLGMLQKSAARQDLLRSGVVRSLVL